MKTLRERFWAKVDMSRTCWLWVGSKNQDGYGTVGIEGRKTGLAHRVAYELINGSIPDGAKVLHACDTPACCNPDHLFLGTHTDNMRDKVEKGRAHRPIGVLNPKARLTPELVQVIRERVRNGESQRKLAAEYGVQPAAINKIVLGRSWRDE